MTAAEELERWLGDPAREQSTLSYAGAVARDARAEPAGPVFDRLTGWGLPGHLVPEAFGGRMRSVAASSELFRVIARRDPAVAVGYGSTFLGAVPVWLWGTAEQRRVVAGRVAAGEFGSCAISERGHGSDLANNECRATRDGDLLRLTGEKWPIGNATRGGFATVLTRTSPAAFSLLLVDKAALPEDRWATLPPASTLGLRGHDLGGLSFADCHVPASATVGVDGAGLAQVLKTLQVTRPLVAALSLGVLDTALRLTLDYAQERRLYGAPIGHLPVIRETLVKAYLNLLICECVAVPVARAVSTAPAGLCRWSPVVKYLVPALVEESLASLAGVLSARSFLQDELVSRLFDKLRRDHAVMSIFDGTSLVSLAAVAASGSPGRPATGHDPAADPVAARLFGWDEPAAPWQPDGADLPLTRTGPDEITDSWGYAVSQLQALARARPAAVPGDLLAAVESWHGVRARYQAELRQLGDRARDRHPPARVFTLARTHCLFHAAASCVLSWLHNRSRLGGPFPDAGWLVLCLHRLLQQLDADEELPGAHLPAVEAEMYRQLDKNELFSLDPHRLG